MPTDTGNLVALSPEKCRRLLRSHAVRVGRLAVTDIDGQPLIVPVNYHLDGDTVVIRTDPTSLLAERAAGHRVAFEVDEVDPAWEDGWSVLIQGTADKVVDVVELGRLRRLPLRPWASGERPLYLRITPAFVTGRQIA